MVIGYPLLISIGGLLTLLHHPIDGGPTLDQVASVPLGDPVGLLEMRLDPVELLLGLLTLEAHPIIVDPEQLVVLGQLFELFDEGLHVGVVDSEQVLLHAVALVDDRFVVSEVDGEGT